MSSERKIRVAVVFGGRSAEHAVSCLGAGHVLAAIDRDRYEVVPIGIAPDGRWVLTSDDPALLAIRDGELPSVDAVATPGTEIAARLDRGAQALVVTGPGEVPRSLGEVDVVLPLLHGTYGEDGTLQGLLEMTGTCYAGAGVLASAAGMDKEYMKLIFAARGLPLGRYVVVRDRDWRGRPADPAQSAGTRRTVGRLGPAGAAGSERAQARARRDRRAGLAAVRQARPRRLQHRHHPRRQPGRARGGDRGRARVRPQGARRSGGRGHRDRVRRARGGRRRAARRERAAQVLVGGDSEFYDFQAKYLEADTALAIPPPIPAGHAEQIRQLACAAFEALSCEGLARVDFFYTPGGQILINEINTMPGMTSASAFPVMWAASGLPLPQLVERIIQTALRKRGGLR